MLKKLEALGLDVGATSMMRELYAKGIGRYGDSSKPREHYAECAGHQGSRWQELKAERAGF